MVGGMKKLNIFFFYLIGDLVLVGVSLYLGGLWLLNTQVAFIASVLIVFATYFGYERFAKGRALSEVVEDEEVNEEEEKNKDEKNKDEENKDEKEKFFEKSKRVAGGIGGSFSLFRLFGYLFLILSFFYLNRHGLFLPFAFLAGLGVVPLVTLLSAFFIK